jgi:hypothetical protein
MPALEMHRPDCVAHREIHASAATVEANPRYPAVLLHFLQHPVCRENILYRNQINDVVSNSEAVIQKHPEVRVRRVAHNPINRVAPLEKVTAFAYLAPLRAVRHLVEKRPCALAWVKHSAARLEPIDHVTRAPVRRVHHVAWVMFSRKQRFLHHHTPNKSFKRTRFAHRLTPALCVSKSAHTRFHP